VWRRAIPRWGNEAVARGKCGLGKVANIDWQEISLCAIKNATIQKLKISLSRTLANPPSGENCKKGESAVRPRGTGGSKIMLYKKRKPLPLFSVGLLKNGTPKRCAPSTFGGGGRWRWDWDWKRRTAIESEVRTHAL
jgi:hypothetical protein